ncbi:Fic family protein [Xenorhabdus sp. PB30.3]|uniref:Fic family protein n=1 Tax=Xenorhabdus sp. PB30.3 TaxID=2788941 RepID=UPI001E4E82DE|nr:Fic family protein [Xenorhabdus sp. PB30.3]MCC8381207.1 Fic family protein [Xenorhabdus sp. PB30.3]
MWIWEQKDWPDFQWNERELISILREINFNQGLLLGLSATENTEQATLDNLLASILYSCEIEGEKLNVASVRSSLANHLGISEETPYPISEQSDGIARIAFEVVEKYQEPLTLERILQWHEWMFPVGYRLINPISGGQLRHGGIEVVSGRIDKPVVHFSAPPAERLEQEVAAFITWFNRSYYDPNLDPILRAAIVHLWFVTLHPLEDGNGRITRFLTDLALAQAESRSIRLYAMSVSICESRKQYYEMLEQTQRGGLDITGWMRWFLQTLNNTLIVKLKQIDGTVKKTRFWRRVDQSQLNEEQVKVLNRMLDGDFSQGINSSQYQKVAKVSRATATRHLIYLTELGYLEKTEAGGRSTRYVIHHVNGVTK